MAELEIHVASALEQRRRLSAELGSARILGGLEQAARNREHQPARRGHRRQYQHRQPSHQPRAQGHRSPFKSCR